LRKYCKKRVRDNPKSPGLQYLVAGQILSALIRHYAEIQGSPKTIARKLIGIAGVVSVFVMQSMAIHPGDRIYIDPEDVIYDSDDFYEPFLIVECAMSDSQMKDIGQIQPGKKPTRNKIDSAYQHSGPRSELSWGKIHTSQPIGQNNQIAYDVVYFHVTLRGLIQTEIRARFK